MLLTEPILNPRANREKTLQKMFEVYGFGAVAMQSQATLTLFAQGESQVAASHIPGIVALT